MSPRYRFGHTSSPWRQERGAECKTSSSSWRDGVLHVLLESSVAHFPPSSGSVLLTFSRSESHLASDSAPETDFLSIISKLEGSNGTGLSLNLNHTAVCSLHRGCCITETLTVKNRWCSLANTLSQTLHSVFTLISLDWKPHLVLSPPSNEIVHTKKGKFPLFLQGDL